ncbi:uncharacterized protein LOC124162682 [Ischnura elegans]|uniref:uncharacterized protein LOC124162682 n=1 Tax=Ischnura elegans TaxID=197161 RepID=UPI001ED89028|nr:uncharacterized protein LOC124162682 [Ischnura elegans]
MFLKFALLLVVVVGAAWFAESAPVEDLNAVIPHDASFHSADPVNRYPPIPDHHAPGYHPPAAHGDDAVSSIVRSALAIPIGILQSLQQSLHKLVNPNAHGH